MLFSFRNRAKSFGNTLQCRPIPARYPLMIPCATQRLTVSPETWQIRAISKVVNTVFFIFIMWTILNIFILLRLINLLKRWLKVKPILGQFSGEFYRPIILWISYLFYQYNQIVTSLPKVHEFTKGIFSEVLRFPWEIPCFLVISKDLRSILLNVRLM